MPYSDVAATSVKHGSGTTLTYLPWLTRGHRYGSEQTDAECEYCILKLRRVHYDGVAGKVAVQLDLDAIDNLHAEEATT